MTETYKEFVTSRINRVREELDTVEAILLNRRNGSEWKLELADATDEFHISVHSVIGLFEASNTPASLLQAEIDERESAQLSEYWSRYDEEDE